MFIPKSMAGVRSVRYARLIYNMPPNCDLRTLQRNQWEYPSGLPRQRPPAPCDQYAVKCQHHLRKKGAGTFGPKAGAQRKKRSQRPVDSLFPLRVIERSDTRKIFAFKELERGPPTGGNVGHLVGEVGLLNGSNRIAAANNGGRIGAGQSLGNRKGAFRESCERVV